MNTELEVEASDEDFDAPPPTFNNHDDMGGAGVAASQAFGGVVTPRAASDAGSHTTTHGGLSGMSIPPSQPRRVLQIHNCLGAATAGASSAGAAASIASRISASGRSELSICRSSLPGIRYLVYRHRVAPLPPFID